jgi:beta-lactam-binding protein with PASTA domain
MALMIFLGAVFAFIVGALLAPSVFPTPQFVSSVGAAGVPPVTVPDLINLERQDARRLIETSNLMVGGQWSEFGPFETMGLVMRQEPEPGALVPAGSPVNIFWNVGPLERPFFPDSLLGKQATRAEETIADWQLYSAGRSRIRHPGYPEGTVIAVSPMLQGSLSVRVPVRLLISLGWEGVPRLSGMSVTDAESLAVALGLVFVVGDGIEVLEPASHGVVQAQTPPPGGEYSEGDTIVVNPGVRPGSESWGTW